MALGLDFNSTIARGLTFIFPENCFEELIIKFNVFHAQCIRLVLSRVLGVAIVLGSSLVKVPQILKIMAARSGAGLSMFSILLEIIGVTSTISYSYVNRFHFSAWGDSCFVGLQTLIIAYLILYYNGRTTAALTLIVVYGVALGYLCTAAPIALLAGLQASNIPVVVAARALQAIQNYRNQSTGQLSAVTCFLLFAGCAARIFTSIQETGDNLVIMTYIVATFMNFVIFMQIIIYWNKKPKTL